MPQASSHLPALSLALLARLERRQLIRRCNASVDNKLVDPSARSADG